MGQPVHFFDLTPDDLAAFCTERGMPTFRASYREVVTSTLPFIVLMLLVLLAVTYVPAIPLFLPGLV